MAFTCVIADDEPLALDGLRRQCMRSGSVEIVGEAADGRGAVALIERLRPQAVFLDIAMPDLTGLDVARELARLASPPRIVLVTAHDHFATEAFDLHVVDYVLKPIDPDRLLRAIERLEAVIPQTIAADESQDLWLPHRGSLARLPVEGIQRIEAERDYVRIYDSDRSYLLRSTLSEILERLGGAFFRIHRSTAVRTDAIKGIRHVSSGAWAVEDIDGRELPIGRSYLAAVRARLGVGPVSGE